MADTWKRLPVILQGLRDRAAERSFDITDQIILKLDNLPKRTGLLFVPHGGFDLWVPVPGNRLLLQAG